MATKTLDEVREALANFPETMPEGSRTWRFTVTTPDGREDTSTMVISPENDPINDFSDAMHLVESQLYSVTGDYLSPDQWNERHRRRWEKKES